MNINLTSAALVAFVSEQGCDVTEQKSFFKVTSPEKNRKAIYIAKSKRLLTRVDFSGFELEECEVIKSISQETAKELKMGAVRGQMLTKNLPVTVTDEQVLEAIRYGIHELLGETEGFKLGKKVQEEETSEDSSEETVEAPLSE